MKREDLEAFVELVGMPLVRRLVKQQIAEARQYRSKDGRLPDCDDLESAGMLRLAKYMHKWHSDESDESKPNMAKLTFQIQKEVKHEAQRMRAMHIPPSTKSKRIKCGQQVNEPRQGPMPCDWPIFDTTHDEFDGGDQGRVDRALDKILARCGDPIDREIVIARYEGFGQEDIAKRVGRSPKQVGRRLKRLYEQLEPQLGSIVDG